MDLYWKEEKKARSRPYLTETITDADFTDDLVLPENTHSSSQISASKLGAGSKKHWSLCELR